MRHIELVQGIKSSVLGFGCAPILGSVDGNTGRKALNIALDYGINHFDLARSYGYGEAENLVGKVLFGTGRDKIVLTSKFGIKANWKASLLKPLKPVVRILRKNKNRTASGPQTNQDNMADLFHTRIKIDAEQMRLNLEKSLKAIHTDYLDYFLIHEPLGPLENIDDLCEAAARLKSEGKIRAWGLAYMKSQAPLHALYLDRFDILQFNNSPGDTDYPKILAECADRSNIFFSPFKGGSPGMTPVEKLQKLSSDFSNSVILCSMFNANHLKENINSIIT